MFTGLSPGVCQGKGLGGLSFPGFHLVRLHSLPSGLFPITQHPHFHLGLSHLCVCGCPVLGPLRKGGTCQGAEQPRSLVEPYEKGPQASQLVKTPVFCSAGPMWGRLQG